MFYVLRFVLEQRWSLLFLEALLRCFDYGDEFTKNVLHVRLISPCLAVGPTGGTARYDRGASVVS